MSFLPYNLFGALPDIMMGRDPKQALLGNAAAVSTALAMPGMMGGAQGAGMLGAGNGSQAGMLAAQEAGLGSSSLGWGGATTGMQGALNSTLGSSAGAQAGGLLGSAGQYAKPAMQAAQVAQAMRPPEQPMQAPTLLPPTASPTLAQIAQQYDPQPNMDWQRRQMRQKRIGLIGGY